MNNNPTPPGLLLFISTASKKIYYKQMESTYLMKEVRSRLDSQLSIYYLHFYEDRKLKFYSSEHCSEDDLNITQDKQKNIQAYSSLVFTPHDSNQEINVRNGQATFLFSLSYKPKEHYLFLSPFMELAICLADLPQAERILKKELHQGNPKINYKISESIILLNQLCSNYDEKNASIPDFNLSNNQDKEAFRVFIKIATETVFSDEKVENVMYYAYYKRNLSEHIMAYNFNSNQVMQSFFREQLAKSIINVSKQSFENVIIPTLFSNVQTPITFENIKYLREMIENFTKMEDDYQYVVVSQLIRHSKPLVLKLNCLDWMTHVRDYLKIKCEIIEKDFNYRDDELIPWTLSKKTLSILVSLLRCRMYSNFFTLQKIIKFLQYLSKCGLDNLIYIEQIDIVLETYLTYYNNGDSYYGYYYDSDSKKHYIDLINSSLDFQSDEKYIIFVKIFQNKKLLFSLCEHISSYDLACRLLSNILSISVELIITFFDMIKALGLKNFDGITENYFRFLLNQTWTKDSLLILMNYFKIEFSDNLKSIVDKFVSISVNDIKDLIYQPSSNNIPYIYILYCKNSKKYQSTKEIYIKELETLSSNVENKQVKIREAKTIAKLDTAQKTILASLMRALEIPVTIDNTVNYCNDATNIFAFYETLNAKIQSQKNKSLSEAIKLFADENNSISILYRTIEETKVGAELHNKLIDIANKIFIYKWKLKDIATLKTEITTTNIQQVCDNLINDGRKTINALIAAIKTNPFIESIKLINDTFRNTKASNDLKLLAAEFDAGTIALLISAIENKDLIMAFKSLLIEISTFNGQIKNKSIKIGTLEHQVLQNETRNDTLEKALYQLQNYKNEFPFINKYNDNKDYIQLLLSLFKMLNQNIEAFTYTFTKKSEDIESLRMIQNIGINKSIIEGIFYFKQFIESFIMKTSLSAMIENFLKTRHLQKHIAPLENYIKVIKENIGNLDKAFAVLNDRSALMVHKIKYTLNSLSIIISDMQGKISLSFYDKCLKSAANLTLKDLESYLNWIYLNMKSNKSVTLRNVFDDFIKFYKDIEVTYKIIKEINVIGYCFNTIEIENYDSTLSNSRKEYYENLKKEFLSNVELSQSISSIFYYLQGQQIYLLMMFFKQPALTHSYADIFKYIGFEIKDYMKAPISDFKDSNDICRLAEIFKGSKPTQSINYNNGVFFYCSNNQIEGVCNIINEMLQNKTDNISLRCWQILICERRTVYIDVIRWLKRAKQTKVPHILLYPESLSMSTQGKVIQYISKYLQFADSPIGIVYDKSKDVTQHLLQYVKNTHILTQNAIYDIENIKICDKNLLFVKGLSGSGKSHFITKIKPTAKYLSAYLMGNISIKKIIKLLITIENEESAVINFQVGDLKDSRALNGKNNELIAMTIIMQILFDRSISYKDALFYFPNEWSICFEIKSECRSKSIHDLIKHLYLKYPHLVKECIYRREAYIIPTTAFQSSLSKQLYKEFGNIVSQIDNTKLSSYTNYNQIDLFYQIYLTNIAGLVQNPLYQMANMSDKLGLQACIINGCDSLIKNQSKWTDLTVFIPYFNKMGFMYLNPNDTEVPSNLKIILVNENIQLNPSFTQLEAEANLFPKIGHMNSSQIFELVNRWCVLRPKKESGFKEYVLTKDNYSKVVMAYIRLDAGAPVIMQGETGCGKTAIIKFMARLFDNQFKAINIHPGITYNMLSKEISDIEFKAEQLPPNKELWVFIDEFNTSCYIEVITELLIRHQFEGRKLSPKVKLIAACNPYKEQVVMNASQYGLISDVKVYSVNEMPQSLKDYIWDFGELNFNDSKEYISNIFANINLTNEDRVKLCDCIVWSINYSNDKAKDIERISLRDINRIKKIFNSLSELMVKLNELSVGNVKVLNTCNSIASLTLYFNFYLRLCTTQDRDLYMKFIKERYPNANESIQSLNDVIMNEMQIPGGIARNAALTENLTMLFIVTYSMVPLFICGKPGSSKTLSVKILIDSLKGRESKEKLFKNLYRLSPIYFQGSDQCTANDIEKLYKTALRQSSKVSDTSQNRVLILFDEIGLAAQSKHCPLNYLHSKLEIEEIDSNKIIFIGVSNWSLDFSKMNRMIKLARVDPSKNELIQTANHMINSTYAKKAHKQIEAIVDSYQNVIDYLNNDGNYKNAVGLRDVYDLFRLINTKLEQLKKDDANTLNIACLESIDQCIDNIAYDIDINKIFKETFTNKMQIAPIKVSFERLIENNLKNDQRYLMVIGENEYFEYIIHKHFSKANHNFQLITPSCFEKNANDPHYGKELLGTINHYAFNGLPIIMYKMNNLYPNLYELFNQNYTERNNEKYSKIWIGNDFNSDCKIHPNFKVILLAEESLIKFEKAPLLNRFEKHLIPHFQKSESQMEKLALFSISKDKDYLVPLCFPLCSDIKYSHINDLCSTNKSNSKDYLIKIATIDSFFLSKSFNANDNGYSKCFESLHSKSFITLYNEFLAKDGGNANIIVIARKELQDKIKKNDNKNICYFDIDSFTKEKDLQNKIYSSTNSMIKHSLIFEMTTLNLTNKLWMLKSLINTLSILDNAQQKCNIMICIVSHRNYKALMCAPILLFADSFSIYTMEELSELSDLDLIKKYTSSSVIENSNILSIYQENLNFKDSLLLAQIIDSNIFCFPNYMVDLNILLQKEESQNKNIKFISQHIYSTIIKAFNNNEVDWKKEIFENDNVSKSITFAHAFDNCLFSYVSQKSKDLCEVLIKGKAFDSAESLGSSYNNIWVSTYDSLIAKSMDFSLVTYYPTNINFSFPFICVEYSKLLLMNNNKMDYSSENEISNISIYNTKEMLSLFSNDGITKSYIIGLCEVICYNEGYDQKSVAKYYSYISSMVSHSIIDNVSIRCKFIKFMIIKFKILKTVLEIISCVLGPLEINAIDVVANISYLNEYIVSWYYCIAKEAILKSADREILNIIEKLFFIGVNIKHLVVSDKDKNVEDKTLLLRANKFKYMLNLWIGLLKVFHGSNTKKETIKAYAIGFVKYDWNEWNLTVYTFINDIIDNLHSNIPNNIFITQIFFGFILLSSAKDKFKILEAIMCMLQKCPNLYTQFHNQFYFTIFKLLLQDKLNKFCQSSQEMSEETYRTQNDELNNILGKLGTEHHILLVYLSEQYAPKQGEVLSAYLEKQSTLNKRMTEYIIKLGGKGFTFFNIFAITIMNQYTIALMKYLKELEVKRLPCLIVFNDNLQNLNPKNKEQELLLQNMKYIINQNISNDQLQNIKAKLNYMEFLTKLNEVQYRESNESIIAIEEDANNVSRINFNIKNNAVYSTIITKMTLELYITQLLYYLQKLIKQVDILYQKGMNIASSLISFIDGQSNNKALKDVWFIFSSLLNDAIPHIENMLVENTPQNSMTGASLNNENIYALEKGELAKNLKSTSSLDYFILNSSKDENGYTIYKLLCFLCSLHNYILLQNIHESQYRQLKGKYTLLIPYHAKKIKESDASVNKNKEAKVLNPLTASYSCFIKFEDLSGDPKTINTYEAFQDYIKEKNHVGKSSGKSSITYDYETLESIFGEMFRGSVLFDLDSIPKYPSKTDIKLNLSTAVKIYVGYKPITDDIITHLNNKCEGPIKFQIADNLLEVMQIIIKYKEYNNDMDALIRKYGNIPKNKFDALKEINKEKPIKLYYLVSTYNYLACKCIKEQHLNKDEISKFKVSEKVDIAKKIDELKNFLKGDIYTVQEALMLIWHRKSIMQADEKMPLDILLKRSEFWEKKDEVDAKQMHMDIALQLNEYSIKDIPDLVKMIELKLHPAENAPKADNGVQNEEANEIFL